jgi:hypothetical protein
LPDKIINRLSDIWTSLEFILSHFFDFLETFDNNSNYNITEIDLYKVYNQFPPRKKLRLEENEKIIYSIEFYITDKLLKKIWKNIKKLSSRNIRFIITKK